MSTATSNAEVVRGLISHFHARLLGSSPRCDGPCWDAIMIYKLRDHQVVEQWASEDWAALLASVGDYSPPWSRS